MEKKKRLLLIDDDEDDIFLFKEALLQTGTEVTFFYESNSQHALSILQKGSLGPLDMIFVDWNMPVRNGLECVREIRKMPAYQNTPVIVWSTTIDVNDIRNVTQVGASQVFRKPNNIEDLVTGLSRFVTSQ